MVHRNAKGSEIIEAKMIDIAKVSGIGDYKKHRYGDKKQDQIFKVPNGKAFALVRKKTLELRCDQRLCDLLEERYETVMESRYFGKGGIEIIPTGQIPDTEIEDLVRLSYNLTLQES